AGIFPVLGLFQFIDGISAASQLALCAAAAAKPPAGILLVITAYYIIGICPSEFTGGSFTTSLRVFGLWLGLLIGICITAPTYIFLLCRQDWNRQAELAQERIQVAEERQQVYDTEAELEDSGRSPSTKAKRAASEA
uniref:Multidrug efflux RND transporter permease subunit n=1 Tax=Macrostomum lignano TaxID=282301 RepID=A0A1I8H2V2_9PLAT